MPVDIRSHAPVDVGLIRKRAKLRSPLLTKNELRCQIRAATSLPSSPIGLCLPGRPCGHVLCRHDAVDRKIARGHDWFSRYPRQDGMFAIHLVWSGWCDGRAKDARSHVRSAKRDFVRWCRRNEVRLQMSCVFEWDIVGADPHKMATMGAIEPGSPYSLCSHGIGRVMRPDGSWMTGGELGDVLRRRLRGDWRVMVKPLVRSDEDWESCVRHVAGYGDKAQVREVRGDWFPLRYLEWVDRVDKVVRRGWYEFLVDEVK